MLNVADLTDGRLAVQTDEANLTRGQTNLRHAVGFLGNQLCHRACGANELCALARVDFDVVDDSTDRNVRDRERVARLDVGFAARVDHVARLQSFGSNDIALRSLGVLKQCDIRGSVRVVLDPDDRVRLVILALEVDDTVLDLVSAASVANGNATVAVSTMRPLGRPPMPSARSSASEPVEMASTFAACSSPQRMIEPLP